MLLRTRPAPRRQLTELTVVIILLLLQWFLRVYHNTAQGAYVDEGFHSMVSTTIWQSGAPTTISVDGKILLYYYLGLFPTTSVTALFISRAAIAFFALLTGAVIYRLGHTLHSHTAGVLALLLYSVLPLTVFHERMVLADPLAAGFGCLVAWRTYVFARHPRWQEGIMLGVLLALATLAKLTLGLLPLLPVILSLIYFPAMAGTVGERLRRWLRDYFGPLVLSALVMTGFWLPVLVSSLIHQTTLLPSVWIASSGANNANPLAYLSAILRETQDFTGSALLLAAVVAAAYLLLNRRFTAFYLIFWLAVSTLLTFGFASTIMPRYLLPGVAPLVLILAVALADLWYSKRWRLILRAGVLVTAGAWLIVFAVPFLYTDLMTPATLPLTGRNAGYFLSSAFNADETTIQAARLLDNADPLIRVDPAVKVVYGDWVVCRLIYFYMQRPVTCLLEPIYKQQLADFTRADLAPGESAYLIMNDIGTGPNSIDGLCPTPFVKYAHTGTYSLVIWRVQRTPCDPAPK